MKSTDNYYEILEVNENASIEVIDKAYRVLAKKYHPDVYTGDKKEAERIMKKLNEAYDVLSDESKRSNYDFILKKKKELDSINKSTNYSSTENDSSEKSSINNNQYENDTPLNNPSKYDKEKFVVDTTFMDDKQKKKIEKKLQERYVEAYDNYLRSKGYRLKYKWTFKRILNVFLTIVCVLIIFTILFFIPPIHEYLINLYHSNIILEVLVDTIISIFSTIGTIFKTTI